MNDIEMLQKLAEANSYSKDSALPEVVWSRDLALREIERRINMEKTNLHESTDASPTARPVRTRRGWVVALGVFVAVLAIGGLLALLNRSGTNNVTDPSQTTTPPTTAVESAGDADVAVVEAAVAAWYGGDFETVSQLLVIPVFAGEQAGWTEEQLQDQMEYDVAVGTRPGEIDCTAPSEPGEAFQCNFTALNALTDAIGLTPPPGGTEMVFQVEDNVVVAYEIQTATFVTKSFGVFLAGHDPQSGYVECLQDRKDAGCAEIELENVDEWAQWTRSEPAEEIARAYLGALFDEDCSVLFGLSDEPDFPRDGCPFEAQYEVAMAGQLDLLNCEVDTGDSTRVTCDALYSNALHAAVGAAPVSRELAVEVVEFLDIAVGSRFVSNHPQDGDLLDSWRDWAATEDRVGELDDVCGPGRPQALPDCATFMLDNLDAWAAWYAERN